MSNGNEESFKAPSGDEKSPFPINVGRRPNFWQYLLGGADFSKKYKVEDDPTTQNIGKTYGPGKKGGKGKRGPEGTQGKNNNCDLFSKNDTNETVIFAASCSIDILIP